MEEQLAEFATTAWGIFLPLVIRLYLGVFAVYLMAYPTGLSKWQSLLKGSIK